MQKTEELFVKWTSDRREGSFASRLLANRLKSRFCCTLDVALGAMKTVGPEGSLDTLIEETKARAVLSPRYSRMLVKKGLPQKAGSVPIQRRLDFQNEMTSPLDGWLRSNPRSSM